MAEIREPGVRRGVRECVRCDEVACMEQVRGRGGGGGEGGGAV